MRLMIMASIGLLAGCGQSAYDNQPCETQVWYADNDLDGYGDASEVSELCDDEVTNRFVGNDEDCDDANVSIHPAADEFCNEIDDNCDGEVDNDVPSAPLWYIDTDNDGYGDPQTSISSCVAVTGYSNNSSDCDDGDEAINPSASELCDEIDNDCDGEVDEVDTLEFEVYYADADMDGYGDPDAPFKSCMAVDGYVSNAEDCDDEDAAISPDALEVCEDGVDNDCDGFDVSCKVEETIEVSADTYVTSYSASSNFGGVSLEIDRSYDKIYLRFDLSHITPGMSVLSATLQLTAYNGYAYGGDGNVYTHLVTDDSWDEFTMTWNNRPSKESDTLGSWWLWYDYTYAETLATNDDPALAAAIEAEIAEDGVVSFLLESPGYHTQYFSREEADSLYRPQLILTYEWPD